MRSTTLALLALISACGRATPTEGTQGKPPLPAAASGSAEHEDEPAHRALPKRIKLSEKVIAAAGITTAPVGKELLATTLALPGEISVDPDKNARVASPVAGRIVRVLFKEGSLVKKGELLATIRIADLARLRAEHASSSAKAASANTNAERLQELLAKGLVSNQEALNAKSEAQSLEAEKQALEEQLHLLGTATNGGGGSEIALRAPISGTVISRAAVVGQPLTTEQTIANIADLSEVWFLGRIFEKDLDDIRVGAKAEVTLNAFPKRRFDGSVEYVGRQVDEVARTVTARIRIGNQDDVLRLGLFGTAHVEVGAQLKQPVLVVPRSAVTEIGDKPVVFVRQPDGDFDLHELALGQASLGKVEVISGLREGEQVVVDGAFTLKSALLQSSAPDDD